MNILFIGNSHTFTNALPFQIQTLAGSKEVNVTMLAASGVSLGWHAEQLETQMNILYGIWDYIVLQQATHPFSGQDALRHEVNALMAHIRKTSAKPVLFMTWAAKREPEKQTELTEAFTTVANEIKALLVPVGLAWQSLIKSSPETNLFDNDGEHANALGSYLSACVFLKVLFNKNPIGLPFEIARAGKTLVNLTSAEAKLIQGVAAKF